MSIKGNWDRRRVEAVSRMGEMDRRKFVKLAGISAAALVFGAGPFTEKAWAQPTFSAYPFSLEAVMNSIRKGLGMRKTGDREGPGRPENPHSYALFTQVHNTL